MFEFIRSNQLNIMLVLCGVCATMVLLLLLTRFLSGSRKGILVFMELTALFLLWFDRQAYIYAGVPGSKSYVMVRVSNFMVFFLTPAIVLGLTLYVADWMRTEGKEKHIPFRLRLCSSMAVLGMLLAVVAAFTNLYYYFDETNKYHRGNGFIISYIIPVICPFIVFSVLIQYRKVFTRIMFRSLMIYTFAPLFFGILQIFTYGISIVNMSMVMVSIFLYISTYLDINNTVSEAHEIQIRDFLGRQTQMYRIFDQTATAFVSAAEKKDEYAKGTAQRTAAYAKKIAEYAGKSVEDCNKIYYAALLHDIGLLGIPDEILKNDSDLKKREMDIMQQKPLISYEILSKITEYPFLSLAARYCHEKYNGTGYPDGLKGKDIPEVARIIAVANTYVAMTSRKRYRDAKPTFLAREVFVEGAGEEFDPEFADIMVKIIDSERNDNAGEIAPQLESEITCTEYRENISAGISVENEVQIIGFECELAEDKEFRAPSIVLFDSYDGRVHDNEKAIKGYHYVEYAEIWFDKNSRTTAARKIDEKETEEATGSQEGGRTGRYEIISGRFEDHIRLIMKAPNYSKEVVIALPGGSKKVYIGLTGENCKLSNITVEPTGRITGQADIPRIAKPVSFLDHLESDIKNIQIDRFRSAHTEGLKINGRIKLALNTMSLPGADFIWNCPYVVLFSSDNGLVNGAHYREYALIKFNGEIESTEQYATNRFIMKRKDSFPGWDEWKKININGIDCELSVEKKGDQVVFKTENLGVSIENITSLHDKNVTVYMALTGDQIALTDIRFIN
ncbi:MAG: HD domain-containing protein [Lachnospiraceae bacterium]|nr:HD domain-containing protein [Lachnospiraceae bacterium]